jgi:hypothetical protein
MVDLNYYPAHSGCESSNAEAITVSAMASAVDEMEVSSDGVSVVPWKTRQVLNCVCDVESAEIMVHLSVCTCSADVRLYEAIVLLSRVLANL